MKILEAEMKIPEEEGSFANFRFSPADNFLETGKSKVIMPVTRSNTDNCGNAKKREKSWEQELRTGKEIEK